MESPNRSSACDAPLLTESEKDSMDELPTMFHMPSYGKNQRSRWWQHRVVYLLLLIAYSLVLLAVPGFWRPNLDPFLTYSTWPCLSLL